MRSSRLVTVLVSIAVSLAVSAGVASAAPPGNPHGHCGRMDRIDVPGAELQEVSCLDDLTTAGTTVTGHTNPADYAGLSAPGTINPTGVPGIQIDGYFPDTSTFNKTHGWNHDAQFVIRVPDRWNGGLVVSGAPGVRTQYANDYLISDWVLAQGYAFASTDKGNSGPEFFKDGEQPGDAIVEWHERFTELTVAAKVVLKQRYAKNIKQTIAMGVSNGGYLVRWQLENNPQLYDGGVDWEGTLFTPEVNMHQALPVALKNYPAYAATGDPAAHQAILDAGFEPGSEFLWAFHYAYYWDVTQRTYREELDPLWDGDLQAGIPFCASGTPYCDADYDYDSRPQEVKDTVARISLTGNIGKPMITLHGTYDTLLPISIDSDVYAQMIAGAGKTGLHRYYRYEAGTHVDGLHAVYPDQIRPLLPCARSSFTALVAWLDRPGTPPPPSATLPRPTEGDLVNTCSLSA